MKPVRILTLTLALLSAYSAAAQGQFNILKLGGNLEGLFDGNDSESYWGGAISLEHQLKRRTTLGFDFAYNSKKSSASDGTITVEGRASILTIQPEFRFYPHAAGDGFYVGFAPALRILKVKITGVIQVEDSSTRGSVGLTTGYQFALSNALRLQFGGGIGFILPNENDEPTGTFNLNLLLGYQF